jgi:DNA-binding winged helix-turn-helix (wHTH) protein/Tol biopolymer transport system component
MESPDAVSAYEFDDIRVDLRLLAVTRAGAPVDLEPKTFEVLRYLIEHRDRLVTKDELLDTVWSGVFVTPNVLTRAVAQLRKSIGDEAHDSRFIETVAKRGYRFIGTVKTAGNGSTAANIDVPVHPPEARVARNPVSATIWFGALLAAAVLLSAWAIVASRPPAPRPLPSVQRLTTSGDVIDAVISRDGKYVAYVRSSGGKQSLWIRQTSGASAVQLVPDAEVGYWGMAFGPDSSSIYYGVKGRPPDADPSGTLLVTGTLPGAPPRRLLTGIDSAVSFAPDGRRLAYYRSEPGHAGSSSLVIADIDGTNIRPIVTKHWPDRFVPVFFGSPSWAPDGRTIAAAVQQYSKFQSMLVTVDAEAGSERVLRAEFANISFTAWTPDGAGVIFTGQQDPSWTTPPQLWFQPADGGLPRRVTSDTIEYRNISMTADRSLLLSVGTDHSASIWTVGLDGGSAAKKIPSMRGDGLVGVTANHGRFIFAGFESGEPQIWSMNGDGSERRQLTADGFSAWPSVTRDGRTIYFISSRGSRPAIWRMDADGRQARLVARPDAAWRLCLSSDERWLYFTSFDSGDDVTWRVPSEGGTPTIVARGLSWASPSPDGTKVAGIWHPSPESPIVLAVFASDGSEREPLQLIPGNYPIGGGEKVRWTSDGRSLLVTTTEVTNIWRVPLAGGPPVRMTDFAEGAIASFTLADDGSTIVMSRGPSVRDAFLIKGAF